MIVRVLSICVNYYREINSRKIHSMAAPLPKLSHDKGIISCQYPSNRKN
jgi:hypothetical protein